jgi:hypothetical protein
MSSEQPAKLDGLELHEAEGGVIIFNEAADRVHHLNNTAAIVLELCDGTRGPEEIASMVAIAFGLDEPPVAATERCLVSLRTEGLVS